MGFSGRFVLLRMLGYPDASAAPYWTYVDTTGRLLDIAWFWSAAPCHISGYGEVVTLPRVFVFVFWVLMSADLPLIFFTSMATCHVLQLNEGDQVMHPGRWSPNLDIVVVNGLTGT